MKNDDLVNRLIQAEGQGVSSTRFNNKPLFWESAHGCKIVDISGRQYLDFTSSYGVMGIGYAHPKVQIAVNNQLNKINHTMCEIFPHQEYLIALENIKSSLSRNEDQVIMTVTGSDAIDVALKLSLRYTNKTGVISFCDAFHGQTLGELSVTGQKNFRTPFSSLINNKIQFIPYPNIYRNNFDTEEELLKDCVLKIKEIIENNNSENTPIGAILVEPMQNAAGYIVPPKGFLRGIRKICNEFKLLMIVDEVFTGFGRCGEWLMSNDEDIAADIVCVGKAMTSGFPGAACIASKNIMSSLDYPGLVPLHGSTFTGNLLTCAAINATISVLKEENLVEKSNINGEYLRNNLRNIFSENPFIGDIRGFGSATMIEFVFDRKTKERNSLEATNFSNYLMKNSIISLISGLPYGNCVALCPPFVINQKELDYLLEICNRYNSIK